MEKIYDIIPPNLKLEIPKEKKEKAKFSLKFSVKKNFFYVIIFVLTFFSVYYLVQGKTIIEIIPQTQLKEIDNIEISIKSGLGEIDFDGKILPAIFLQDFKEYSKDYSTNQIVLKETKASGIIRVYNKYSPPTPLTLIKGTHFLSSSGKSFHSLDVIKIPAAHYEGGELIPGFVDITVEADEPGEEYNIPPSNFSIPKLSGTSYYQTTWAQSFEEIKGGMKAQVKVVSENDIESAKEDFIENFKKKAREEFKLDIPESFVYFEESFFEEVESLDVSAKEGDAVDLFTIKAKITPKVLVFRKEDLNNLIKKILEEDISPLIVLENSLKIEFKEKQINLTQGEGNFVLLASAQTFLPLDEKEVFELIKGKNITDAISTLKNSYSLKEIKINPPVFWQKNIPNDALKIKIKIELSLDKF